MLGKNVKTFLPQPQKQKGCGDMIKYEAKQFCMNTSLHGYRFIVLPKRILLERVVWVILVTLAFIFGITLVCLAWISFQENRTFVLTDSTQNQIWNYPFPAVTVCNYNKLNKNRVYELAKNISESSDEPSINEMALNLRLLYQLVQTEALSIPHQIFSKLQSILDNKKLKPLDVLRYLAPTCEESLQRCRWKGEEKRCDIIFQMIPTSQGFCCAFNYFAMRNPIYPGNLSYKSPKLPRRVSACGYQTGLEILLSNDPNNYFLTGIPSIGHSVLIHNSYYFPASSVQTVLTENRLLNHIDIVPSLTYSTNSLKELDIEKRNCLLFNERKLPNFEGYTYHNCIVECKINLTLNYCGCIPIIFHYKNGNYPKSRNCDLRDLYCLIKYKPMIHGSVELAQKNVENKCNCLPDCEYVEYIAQTSSGRLMSQYATNPNNLYAGFKIDNQSVFRVFFDDLVATRNRRDVTFSWHTLLAYYGGLLGLFVGFSFVSGIEIIYFFTIRLIIDLTKASSFFQQEKNFLNQQNQQIQVQPMEYLDPRRLTLSKEIGNVRQRTNSNPLYN